VGHDLFKFFREPSVKNGPSVAEFWGAPQDSEEQAMADRAKMQGVREARQHCLAGQGELQA